MEFGIIRRITRPISLPEWNRIIASTGQLEQAPDREGTNPFTKEKIVFPGAGKAFYVVGGKVIGNASLEEGEILTAGVPRQLCEKIAQSIDAQVLEDDRS
jgi:hypothetical protein